MTRLVAVLAVVLAAPSLARADWGNGNKITQARPVGAFTAIRSEGALDLVVQVGPAPSVAVTIDENLQRDVEVAVEGDVLVVRTRSFTSWRGEARVQITTPALSGLSLRGSGDATIEGSKGGDLSLDVRGSGDVHWSGAAGKLSARIDGSGDMDLAGRADVFNVAVNGSGDVKAKLLSAVSADATVAGSGDVSLTLAGGRLKARVMGSGDIDWWGTATPVDAQAQGSGDIKQH